MGRNKKRYSVNPGPGQKFDLIHAKKEQKEAWLGKHKKVELSMGKAGKNSAVAKKADEKKEP